YFAASVGPLTLDHPLEASGRVCFKAAVSDSGVTFGWFDSKTLLAESPAGKPRLTNRLGILVEGPSRVGHYFRPEYATAEGKRAIKADGPLLQPDGRPHTWAFRYDPSGANGAGRITFKLDEKEETFDLAVGARKAGATFDRFGIFVREGADGNFVELYLTDLKFTTTPPTK